MNWTPETRLLWTVRLTGIGFIGGIVLSWSLWTNRREYPLFPVWDGIPIFSPDVSALITLFLLVVLGWIVVKPGRWNVLVFLVLMLFLALQDQSRWQPWAYQYVLMLLPLVFVYSRKDEKGTFGVLQFIMVMVYLWGGIHKCQPGWLSVWESSLVAPLVEGRDGTFLATVLLSFGYVIPPIEIAMALGLFFKRTRHLAVILILLTHVSILLLLGPVKGHISNSVVWPWNLVMMAMVVLLFYKQEGAFFTAFKNRSLLVPATGIAVLMTIAPIFFYAGLWDRYLSFSLYAGQQKRYLVQIPAPALPHIPEEWSEYLLDPKAKDGHMLLSPSSWSSKELNVPLISEWRIIRRFSKELCAYDLGGSQVRFYVDHRHLPNKEKRIYTCDQIDEMGN